MEAQDLRLLVRCNDGRRNRSIRRNSSGKEPKQAMSGRIKRMLDEIVQKKSGGKLVLANITMTKLTLKGLNPDSFTASSPDDPAIIATTTDYGYEFCSAVWKDNIFACQYHPEKSQDVGLQVLRNFKGLTEA